MNVSIYRGFGSNENGFTLIEVIVVIVAIDIVASIVALNLLSQPDIARQNTATVSVKSLGSAPQLYPLQQSGLTSKYGCSHSLMRPVDASVSPYSQGGYPGKDALIDPVENAYSYQFPAQFGPYDLICLGKDPAPGEDDIKVDITYW